MDNFSEDFPKFTSYLMKVAEDFNLDKLPDSFSNFVLDNGED